MVLTDVLIAHSYAYLPLLVLFEKEPLEHPPPNSTGRLEPGQATDTALIIPCYKSEKLIAATLEAALKTFSAGNIFVSFSWYAGVDIKLTLTPGLGNCQWQLTNTAG